MIIARRFFLRYRLQIHIQPAIAHKGDKTQFAGSSIHPVHVFRFKRVVDGKDWNTFLLRNIQVIQVFLAADVQRALGEFVKLALADRGNKS